MCGDRGDRERQGELPCLYCHGMVSNRAWLLGSLV